MATRRSATPWCRIGSWGVGTYPAGYAQREFLLADHDLVWISAGEPVYRIDGVDITATDPCLLLLRPGMRMSIRWDRRRTCRNFYVHFTPTGTPGPAGDPRLWPLHTPLPPDEGATTLLRHLQWLLTARPTGWEVLAGSSLGHVVAMTAHGALRMASDTALEAGPLGSLVAATVARCWHGGAPLIAPSLASLAAAAHLSREGLCRAFQLEVGVAPVQALRLVRLERSARLLLNGVPVAQTAERCGFRDPFHFSHAFREAFACTPRSFATSFAAGRSELHLHASAAFTAFRCAVSNAMQWHD